MRVVIFPEKSPQMKKMRFYNFNLPYQFFGKICCYKLLGTTSKPRPVGSKQDMM